MRVGSCLSNVQSVESQVGDDASKSKSTDLEQHQSKSLAINLVKEL